MWSTHLVLLLGLPSMVIYATAGAPPAAAGFYRRNFLSPSALGFGTAEAPLKLLDAIPQPLEEMVPPPPQAASSHPARHGDDRSAPAPRAASTPEVAAAAPPPPPAGAVPPPAAIPSPDTTAAPISATSASSSATAAATSTSAAAAAAQSSASTVPMPATGSWGPLRLSASDQCIEAGATAGASAAFVTCDGAKTAQAWQFAYGKLVSRVQQSRVPLCLSAAETEESGARLVMVACTTSELTALTSIRPDSAILLASSGLCVTSQGGHAVQMACDGAAAATQAFVTVAGGPLRTDTCTNVQTRREWRTLSDSERRAYIAAVETIRKQPSVLGHSSRYDDIVGFHAEALALIHTSGTLVEKDKQGTQFLVWHRAYLRLYEEALQSVDPSVTLPYWEWSSDAQKPLANTAMFGEGPTQFGTNGVGDETCVRDGFARLWTRTTPDTAPCLRRNHTDTVTLYDTETLKHTLDQATDYDQLRIGIEMYSHAVVHTAIGGTTGDMTFIPNSPSDPLFFLHHANVDYWWAVWQKKYPSRVQYNGWAVSAPGHTDVRPASMDDVVYGTSWTVRDAVTHAQGHGFCYQYADLEVPTAKTGGAGAIAPWPRRRRRAVLGGLGGLTSLTSAAAAPLGAVGDAVSGASAKGLLSSASSRATGMSNGDDLKYAVKGADDVTAYTGVEDGAKTVVRTPDEVADIVAPAGANAVNVIDNHVGSITNMASTMPGADAVSQIVRVARGLPIGGLLGTATGAVAGAGPTALVSTVTHLAGGMLSPVAMLAEARSLLNRTTPSGRVHPQPLPSAWVQHMGWCVDEIREGEHKLRSIADAIDMARGLLPFGWKLGVWPDQQPVDVEDDCDEDAGVPSY